LQSLEVCASGIEKPRQLGLGLGVGESVRTSERTPVVVAANPSDEAPPPERKNRELHIDSLDKGKRINVVSAKAGGAPFLSIERSEGGRGGGKKNKKKSNRK